MTNLIVALDTDSLKKQEELLDALHGLVTWYKVGLQLFTAHGRRAIELVRKKDGKVFLDLKLHDIPQTVALAVEEAKKLGADAVSLHLSGGAAMLRAANSVPGRPLLWGVTVLTSMSPKDVKSLGADAKIPSLVRSLAKLGWSNGADAVICSPQEVALVRRAMPHLPVKFVTPGVRPKGAALNDQTRVMTPGDAAALGIDHIVVGRPITHAPDPRKAALEILTEMKLAAPKSLERA